MTKYGILDDFGEVVRWVWERPVGRAYITIQVKRQRKAKVDLSQFGEALL